MVTRCELLSINQARFFATVFFEDDVEHLIKLGVNSIKIASQDILHRDLIRYCAKFNLPLQLDTGNATLGEVERAVDWSTYAGNTKL